MLKLPSQPSCLEFIVNVKCRMDGSACRLIHDTIFCQWTCLTSVNMQEYVTSVPLASLKELHFPWLILKFHNLAYGEWLIFLAWQHMSHSNIVRSSEIQMFFWNIFWIENRRPEILIFFYAWLKKGWRMVFASNREHASTVIFLRARAEIKNLLCEQRAA